MIKFKGIYKNKSSLSNIDFLNTEGLQRANIGFKRKHVVILTTLWILFSSLYIHFYSNVLTDSNYELLFAFILVCISPFFHEILHALWYDTSYIFIYPRGGCFFMVGINPLERNVFLSMLIYPCLCLGIFPFILYLFSNYAFLLIFSVAQIAGSIGDICMFYTVITKYKATDNFVYSKGYFYLTK